MGVVLYISPEELRLDAICPSWAEMRALLHTRNKLAGHIRDAIMGASSSDAGKTLLPPLLRDPHGCQYCYQAAECAAHYIGLEEGTLATSGMAELFGFILKDVTPAQLRYYKHWDDLISLEQTATQLGSSVALVEHNDRVLCGLTLLSCEREAGSENFVVSFARPPQPADVAQEGESSETSSVSPLSVNDRVQISVDGQQAQPQPHSGNSTAAALTGVGDIEDLAAMQHFRQPSRAVMGVEANVCAGVVRAVMVGTVEVFLEQEPRALKR
jgi:ribosomal protein S27AE